jgi:hypothetical protein
MSSERVQSLIHKLEVGGGARLIWTLVGILAIAGLGVLYDLNDFHGFSAPEAMDAAQVARNLEEGHGFSTDFIRPFSLYLVQSHNRAVNAAGASRPAGDTATDDARIDGPHPDLANAPVYPAVLAGLMKTWKPQWAAEVNKPFWTEGGYFQRYKPEFRIAIFNQCLLCVVAVLTFFITRKLCDAQAAWLAAGLTFGSELLWKFSVSGLSTMLLLVIFMGVIWCLIRVDELGREQVPKMVRLFVYAGVLGALTGLGMLTQYSFGWLVVPVVGFLIWSGNTRRGSLGVIAGLAFALVVSPWISRNYSVSGTPFGTAGYACLAGTPQFEGNALMQSFNPNFTGVRWVPVCLKKTTSNLHHIFQGELLTAWGWTGVLFFGGLLLGWRHVTAQRLRYFTVASLAIFLLAEALGRTDLSTVSPTVNSENLLILLLPLVNLFGVGFMLTLLGGANGRLVRIAAITLVTAIICGPLLWTTISKTSPLAYPPYYPPEIQKVANWMQPDELMMSDVPWAVAWYGQRKCAWTTLNCGSEFFALNDYGKSVRGLYLTENTLDAKFMTECLRGAADSWPRFIFRLVTPGLSDDDKFPPNFPLRMLSPTGFLGGVGIFLTDRPRWLPK